MQPTRSDTGPVRFVIVTRFEVLHFISRKSHLPSPPHLNQEAFKQFWRERHCTPRLLVHSTAAFLPQTAPCSALRAAASRCWPHLSSVSGHPSKEGGRLSKSVTFSTYRVCASRPSRQPPDHPTKVAGLPGRAGRSSRARARAGRDRWVPRPIRQRRGRSS